MDDAYWAKLPQVLSMANQKEITGKQERTVWRYLKDGRLPGHRLATTTWIVFREEVRAKLLDEHAQPLTPTTLLAARGDRLTLAELTELFGKSRSTIYDWLHEGVLPGHRIGTSWIVYKSEIIALLEQTSNQRAGRSAP